MMKRAQEEIDVDARFLLANERTLLAWIRTSLAIEAGGIALITVHKHHSYLGLLVLLSGTVIALIGYHRFRAADKAIRAQKLPRKGSGQPSKSVWWFLLQSAFRSPNLLYCGKFVASIPAITQALKDGLEQETS